MSAKAQVLLGMTVGSLIGGYLPVLFGQSIFSMWSLVFNAIGGFTGMVIAYKLSK